MLHTIRLGVMAGAIVSSSVIEEEPLSTEKPLGFHELGKAPPRYLI